MLDIVINKQVRGYILKVLKLSYPHPLGSNVIDTCLVDAAMSVSPTQLQGHLQYLAERQYLCLKKTTLEITGTVIYLVTLSAKGIDLLEKTISDPGVTIK